MATIIPFVPPAKAPVPNIQAAQSNPLLKNGDAESLSNVSGINFIDMLVANFIAHEENKTAKVQINPTSPDLIPVTTAPTVPVVEAVEVVEAIEIPDTIKNDDTVDMAIPETKVDLPISSPSKPSNQNPLALLQIALASQTTDENGNLVLQTTPKAVQAIEKQLTLTNTIIGGLKNVVPENSQKENVLTVVLGKLQSKSSQLQASLSALENGVITKNTSVDDIPSPLLIGLGLNPSEIADITKAIKSLQEKLGRDITVQDLITGVGDILPPPQTAVLAAVTIQPPKFFNAIDSQTEPTDELAAQLNNLDIGSGDEILDANILTANKPKPQPLRDALRDDGVQQNARPSQDSVNQPTPANNKQTQNNDNAPKDNFKNLLNTKNIDSGYMLFPINLFGGDVDSALFQQFGITSTPSLTLGSVAQSANIIGTTAMAGQNHPATNLVGAHILKYAPNGGDQTMSIRLDPPELGHVNIRLKFGKDNSIKAHMIIEKPETYMMLSRDAHALERTLQQSGLDANSSSISFELAGQNENPFNNNGDGNNENGFGSGNPNSTMAIDEDAIQSSVMWQIDPSTGHVRYNLYV